MNQTDGIPPNLIACFVHGHYSDGSQHGAANDRHMRVRAKMGRGYTTAHAGSCSVSARDEAEDAYRGAALTIAEIVVMRLLVAEVPLDVVSVQLRISLRAARGRRDRAVAKLRAAQALVGGMGK